MNITLLFILQFQSQMEDYTNKYIVNTFTEQSLLRALANESLIKARRERAHQNALAIQRLFEYHPALVPPGHTADRNNSITTTASSGSLPTPVASLPDFRRGSFTARSVVSASSTPPSTEGVVQHQQQRLRRFRTSMAELFDCQLVELESRVLARVRRKFWLNLRFEYVRASSTALWFIP